MISSKGNKKALGEQIMEGPNSVWFGKNYLGFNMQLGCEKSTS